MRIKDKDKNSQKRTAMIVIKTIPISSQLNRIALIAIDFINKRKKK